MLELEGLSRTTTLYLEIRFKATIVHREITLQKSNIRGEMIKSPHAKLIHTILDIPSTVQTGGFTFEFGL
jgi:hypothetical protein